MKVSPIANSEVKCYHCGEECKELNLKIDNKNFCCQGCKLVYEVLAENDLCNYYEQEEFPGENQKFKNSRTNRFDYLKDDGIQNQLLDFKSDLESHVSFYIPQIHCASCIWLLENLIQIHSGVINSRVDFIKKKVQIKFDHHKITLKELVSLLSTIGYEPKISLSDKGGEQNLSYDRKLISQLAVAGFCFGNMMLFSLPEYFSETQLLGEGFRDLFNYLNVILSLPVVFYSASSYYQSAWNSVKQRKINMDVPIVLGILALFLYSLWEIFISGNAGFMDSLGGLLFFLLLGKLYQQKTFANLEFDRDYKSYFPMAVTKLNKDKEEVIPISKLEVGDVILIRNEELIPADSILLSENANIDYSFVTGEEIPVPKQKREVIYAGGRQFGNPIILTIQKSPSQGYLTDLWNSECFEKEKNGLLEPLANKVSGIFTWAVLSIAFIAFTFWSFQDLSLAVKSFTSVLIVACPCALAMSTPFTLGNTLRIFGKGKFYLKNASVVEKLAQVDTIVFDKTGTLTSPAHAQIEFIGEELTEQTKSILKSLVSKSSHPLSNRINYFLGDVNLEKISEFKELKGEGVQANFHGEQIKLGSKEFTGSHLFPTIEDGNLVFLSISGQDLGYFYIKSGLRESAPNMIQQLGHEYELHLLSGDHSHEQVSLREKLGQVLKFNFNQSPSDKLQYLKSLNNKGKHTLMVGDGLNDAGALKESEVGIAVTEQVSHFSPASDAILDASVIYKIPAFLSFAKANRNIIKMSFLLSFAYNIIGLSLAVQGFLSPVICAILMPLSSISVVVFTTISTNFIAMRKGLIKLNQN
ncbi:heavy metal translocating P-type ATPase metal-binding domain-containing protein [Algoriphagus sp. SE2]|uniref:heavy metal translocating P-type ATPase n=1 Tax=Algoriphagus sp. SE2 TaxID=3141536 RepID=UPI0031CD71C1